MPVLDDLDYANKCRSCLFWSGPYNSEVALCTRNAPIPAPDGIARWPQTAATDSCGEWLRA